MSHAAIHITFGLVLGALFFLPCFIRALVRGEALATLCGHWLLVSYALGVYAIVPSILGRLGVSAAVCLSPWMNLFLLHPFIRQLNPGGKTVGAALIGVAFLSQYGLLLLLLGYRRRHPLTLP